MLIYIIAFSTSPYICPRRVFTYDELIIWTRIISAIFLPTKVYLFKSFSWFFHYNYNLNAMSLYLSIKRVARHTRTCTPGHKTLSKMWTIIMSRQWNESEANLILETGLCFLCVPAERRYALKWPDRYAPEKRSVSSALFRNRNISGISVTWEIHGNTRFH